MPNNPANQVSKLKEVTASYVAAVGEIGGDVDIALLKASLLMTPWERMLANDDALNFAESLRAAMERRNAKSK